MSKKKTTPARAAGATDAELGALAHHLAEAIRIARSHPALPACLYNDLGDALCNFENNLPSLARASESEAHLLLTLRAFAEQTAEGEGGPR